MQILPLLIILFQIYLIFTVIVLLLDNRSPSETFAWIFVFILMPGFGFLIYFIFGRNYRKNYDRGIKLPQYVAKELVALFKPVINGQEDLMQRFQGEAAVYPADLMMLLYRNSSSLLTIGNKIQVFHNGRDKFDNLMIDIKNARTYIHLEYFIWRSEDPLGQALKNVLVEKAREGIEVRILYDFSGCLGKLGLGYVQELRKNGIQIYPFFNYLSSFKMHTLNYRNHRKIAVIDGRVGYTGGMNVGQEYIDGGKKYASWRDTHVRLEGESVSILQAIFAIDWHNTVHQTDILHPKYFPLLTERPDGSGRLPVQLPTSGYDSSWPSILHLYFSMITAAQKNITIVSPYFIPDGSLLMALKTASMRGVKVVIMMTGVPDKKIPFWAAFSYFEELLKAGVQIFQYQAGFMHAKIFSSDSRVCSIGSANLDIRSLKLNYEINAVIYDQATTKAVDAQIAEDLKHCKEITLQDFNRTSVIARLRNSLVRLISDVL